MTRKPGRAAPMAPDERREAIIEAVIPLLVRRGAGVTTREIAEAAGVAEGTIFRVFPDKCALMMAVARATMDPSSDRAGLADIDPALDLYETIGAVATHLLARMEKVMAVMMAVRGVVDAPDGRGGDHPRPDGAQNGGAAHDGAQHDGAQHDGAQNSGPPAFVVEANTALLEALTEVFERHRDELAVAPERAALMLRSLVFGSHHPAMQHAQTLTAEEVATVLVSGVTRTGVTRSGDRSGSER